MLAPETSLFPSIVEPNNASLLLKNELYMLNKFFILLQEILLLAGTDCSWKLHILLKIYVTCDMFPSTTVVFILV